MSTLLRIGEAAQATAVSAKMIRHYEELGLLPPAPRTDGGYRLYDDAALRSLHFIRRARDLGFSMADIGELLSLWRNEHRSSAAVKQLVLKHQASLQQRIDELSAMHRTLGRLASSCQGNQRPDCAILDDLGWPSPHKPCHP